MDHNYLVDRAGKWLKSHCNCGVVFKEITAYTQNGETPDAIGWRGGISILVECKMSRSDFLADKNKSFRKYPDKGMGKHRYYMCPPDLIKPSDLPTGWGLLYCYPKKIKRVLDPVRGNCEWYETKFKSDELSEIQLMYSGLRRMEIRGHLKEIYDGYPDKLIDNSGD